jgi:hypothetical protein
MVLVVDRVAPGLWNGELARWHIAPGADSPRHPAGLVRGNAGGGFGDLAPAVRQGSRELRHPKDSPRPAQSHSPMGSWEGFGRNFFLASPSATRIANSTIVGVVLMLDGVALVPSGLLESFSVKFFGIHSVTRMDLAREFTCGQSDRAW